MDCAVSGRPYYTEATYTDQLVDVGRIQEPQPELDRHWRPLPSLAVLSFHLWADFYLLVNKIELNIELQTN